MKEPRTTTTHRALRAKEFREQQVRYEASGKVTIQSNSIAFQTVVVQS